MKKYQGYSPMNGRNPRTWGVSAIIGYSSGQLFLNFSRHSCNSRRVDLFLDEDTLDIVVKGSPKGKLSAQIRVGTTRRVSLAGFAKANELDPEDLMGYYLVEKLEDGFLVRRSSRRGEERIREASSRLRHRPQTVISAQLMDLWNVLRGEIPMATFIRESVNMRIQDELPKEWEDYVLGGQKEQGG